MRTPVRVSERAAIYARSKRKSMIFLLPGGARLEISIVYVDLSNGKYNAHRVGAAIV